MLREVVKDKATRSQLHSTRSVKSLNRNGLSIIIKQRAFLCALQKMNVEICKPRKVYS